MARIVSPAADGASHCPQSSPTHSPTTAQSSPDLNSALPLPMLKIRLITGRSLTRSAEALTHRSPRWKHSLRLSGGDNEQRAETQISPEFFLRWTATGGSKTGI